MNTNGLMRYNSDGEPIRPASLSDMTRSHLPPSSRLSVGSTYFSHDTNVAPTLEPRIANTLQKLVQRLMSGNEENRTPDQYDHCASIIASQQKASILEDENYIANLIRRKLMANPKNSAKALKFGHLYNKLESQQVLQKKWSILYLLHILSDDQKDLPSNGHQFLSSGLHSLSSTPTSSSPSASSSSSSSSSAPVRSRETSHHIQQESPRIRRRLTKDTPSAAASNTAVERSLPAFLQLVHARQQRKQQKQQQQQQQLSQLGRAGAGGEQNNNVPVQISETLLLRDLIYIFQGINGQYITFDADSKEYILDPQVTLSRPTQDLVYRLTELGWLYQRIYGFIHHHFDQQSMGLVGQSFCSALQQELMEYYKLIAILEAQIEKQTQPDANFIPSDTSLTLKRLVVWTQESLQRLKLMGVLVDMGQNQKGGALVSTMHNYTNHGDPFFKQYISDMLQEVSKPFYDMLRRWISEGELDDPYGEFFVASDPSVSEEELWQRKYSIREDMLPSFISAELAQKIFSIGKSLNFIRYSCHDETLVEKYYAENSTTLPLHTFKYGDIQAIERSVDMMYLETSKQLLTLLKDKFKLMDHLRALKRYLLLGQGDFIQYLMVTLGPALNRPATTLFRHNLTGVLETAIRASNAQFDDPVILNRLDVRLLEISSQDLGWDVFTLDYHVDSPINTVFSPQAMNQYLKIFNFLWRLKRVEYTLTAAWRRWGTASRTFASVPELSQDLHEAQMVVARMIHFIYQLQHYYLFEVLECSWEKLETKINTKSIDLDSVIDIHSHYLSDIAYKGFLTSTKQQPLSLHLNSIFDVVLAYKTILDHLYAYGTSAISKKTASSSDETSDIEKLTKIRTRLNDVSSKFKTLVHDFLKASKDLGFKIIK